MPNAMRVSCAILLVIITACRTRDAAPPRTTRPSQYSLGHAPTPQEVAAVDLDVNPTGAGLPAGQGTAATGAAVFAGKCAACHGPHGEGIDKNPKIIGAQPPASYNFGNDVKAVKTIGNYWPYPTTM